MEKQLLLRDTKRPERHTKLLQKMTKRLKMTTEASKYENQKQIRVPEAACCIHDERSPQSVICRFNTAFIKNELE